MATLTKKKLVQVISQELGLHPNDVQNVVQLFLDRMVDYLASGDRIEFRDFGVFEVIMRKRKVGRNPKNPSVPVEIPPGPVLKFRPGKNTKKKIELKGISAVSDSASPQSPSAPHFS